MTLWQTALFLVCVALATFAQNLTGFAFAIILLGLAGILNIAPIADLANVATVLALGNAFIALRRSGTALDMPAFRQITLGSMVGIVVGLVLLAWLSSSVALALRALLGLTIMVCAGVVLLQRTPLQERSRPAWFRLWGMVSGLLTGMFAAGGPPLVYQLYRQPMALTTIRVTLVASLAAGSTLRVLVVLASGHFSLHALHMSLLAAPLVFGLSWWLERHPPGWSRQAVLRMVCALLLMIGAGLGVPAIVQMTQR